MNMQSSSLAVFLSVLGGIASCSASNSAYSYTFRGVFVASVVCHIRAPLLNSSMDLHAIWQVHVWGSMTHCVRWGPCPQGKGRFRGSNPQPQHAIANWCCHLASRNEARFRHVTLVLVLHLAPY